MLLKYALISVSYIFQISVLKILWSQCNSLVTICRWKNEVNFLHFQTWKVVFQNEPRILEQQKQIFQSCVNLSLLVFLLITPPPPPPQRPEHIIPVSRSLFWSCSFTASNYFSIIDSITEHVTVEIQQPFATRIQRNLWRRLPKYRLLQSAYFYSDLLLTDFDRWEKRGNMYWRLFVHWTVKAWPSEPMSTPALWQNHDCFVLWAIEWINPRHPIAWQAWWRHFDGAAICRWQVQFCSGLCKGV